MTNHRKQITKLDNDPFFKHFLYQIQAMEKIFDNIDKDQHKNAFFHTKEPTALISDKSSIPVYNITNINPETNCYYVQLQLAGFDKSEIDVNVKSGNNNQYSNVKYLEIHAEKKKYDFGEEPINRSQRFPTNYSDFIEHMSHPDVKYIENYISCRTIKERVAIGSDDEVEECFFENGILHVRLKRHRPEAKEDNVEKIDIK